MTDEPMTTPTAESQLTEPVPAPGELIAGDMSDPIQRRRADIDAKHLIIIGLLAEMGCEAVILFMPAHVGWFTSGMNVFGLVADTERPGIFITNRGRWLVSSNIDSQRLFDEELDRLGFQLKEWQWSSGRAVLLGELVANKKVAADRPFPGMPLINDRLRQHLRTLLPSDQERYCQLGKIVSHAVEATARTLERGQTELEVSGQLAHRLFRQGIKIDSISVTADQRTRSIRRAGCTTAPITSFCVIQATGTRDGLFVTCSRTVSFEPNTELKLEHDLACKVTGLFRSLSRPGETISSAAEAGRRMTAGTSYEYENRESQPGYGAGWFSAEELRRGGQDERFAIGQALTWQVRFGATAAVDTILVTNAEPLDITPPVEWPFKRIRIGERYFDVPDVLVRDEG